MKKNILSYCSAFILILLGVIVYFLDSKFPMLPDIFRNYIPDFLWALAFVLALSPILINIFPKHYALISAIIAFTAGLLFECLQYLNLINGRGDFCDILIYMLASLLGYCIINMTNRTNKTNK